MILKELYKICPKKPFHKDFVDLRFRFRILEVPKELPEDKNFPYEDELFLVNIGEEGKFHASFIYQSKFVVFKEEDHLLFNGYAPDFCRKSNIIRNGGGSAFIVGQFYDVALHLSKYRCYVEINGGEAKTSYGNGRDKITDLIFFARKGVTVELDESNICFSERDYYEPVKDIGLERFIREGLFCNYQFWHNAPDGVYFDRLNLIQSILCTTRNSPAYQTNIMIDAYSDTRNIGIIFEVTDQPTEEWPLLFAFYINGEKQPFQEIFCRKDRVYSVNFAVSMQYPVYNRLTIVFPCSMSLALKHISYDKGAVFSAVEKKETVYFFGDSITEGSECFDPGEMYVNQITRKYDFYAIDQAVSGRTFCDYTILGEYERKPVYVFIACGTNSFCGGVQDKAVCFAELERQMEIVLQNAEKYFPGAVKIALLPIWRSDEKGVNFTLQDIGRKMREIYERKKDIIIIDCYDFIPPDSHYFSNSELALHPNSFGHSLYGAKLLEKLKNILGAPPLHNDAETAKKTLQKCGECRKAEKSSEF